MANAIGKANLCMPNLISRTLNYDRKEIFVSCKDCDNCLAELWLSYSAGASFEDFGAPLSPGANLSAIAPDSHLCLYVCYNYSFKKIPLN